MTIRKMRVLPLALALGAVGAMVMVSVASASHPRPLSASPLSASLVPAYNECTAPNRTHGTPLAFPSCNPPVQSSNSITVGTPDANGADAGSIGRIKIAVKVGVPGPPDDSDVLLTASATDIRCKAGTLSCGNANAVDGADYTGELEGNAQIRITDHYNGPSGTEPGTVVDIPFPVGATCANTANTARGGTCTINTTANAVIGGIDPAVKDGKRAIIEIQQLQVSDGGPDGQRGTGPNTLFAVQGIFIP
jgi:hypothetical protein